MTTPSTIVQRPPITVAVCGLLREPTTELKVLLRMLAHLRAQGIVDRVVLSTWYEEAPNVEPLFPWLKACECEIVFSSAPTTFKESGAIQRASIRTAIRTEKANSYVIRARTDFCVNYLAEVFRCLLSASSPAFDRICALPMDTKNPFHFVDIAFGAPTVTMRKMANRDWAFDASGSARSLMFQLFSGPFIDGFPLLDEVGQITTMDTLVGAIRDALAVRRAIPRDVTRFLSLYMGILSQHFLIPGRAPEAIDVDSLLFGRTPWSTQALSRLANPKDPQILASEELALVLDQFRACADLDELGRGMDDPEHVRSFLNERALASQYSYKAPTAVMPSRIAEENERADGSSVALDGLAVLIAQRILDPSGRLPLLADLLLSLAEAESKVGARDPNRRKEIFEWLLAGARNWSAEALIAAWKFADQSEEGIDRAKLIAIAQYLHREGRSVFYLSSALIAVEIARKGVRQTEAATNQAVRLIDQARRASASGLGEYAVGKLEWAAAQLALHCSRCGGAAFTSGPGGRTALNGRPPACQNCGSVEYHRVFCSLLRETCERKRGPTSAVYIDGSIISVVTIATPEVPSISMHVGRTELRQIEVNSDLAFAYIVDDRVSLRAALSCPAIARAAHLVLLPTAQRLLAEYPAYTGGMNENEPVRDSGTHAVYMTKFLQPSALLEHAD